MNETLIAGLISDNDEAIASFGECDNCVVVDWRDGAEEIFEAVTSFLPQDYLHVASNGGTEWRVRASDRPEHTIEFLPITKHEDFFVVLNQILAPDFELRQFTPVNGDGYSIFLAPSLWWRSFEAQHPKVLSKYFLSTDRLAAHMKKGYFARLFSKP